jgi:hypothetical protein
VAVAAAALSAQDPGGADLTPQRNSSDVVTAPFDPALGAALAATGSAPITPTHLDEELRIPLQHDSRTARLQNALGALLWRGLSPDSEPRTQIVLPPLTWDLNPGEAQSLLTSVASAIRAGLAEPRPLPAVILETPRAAPPEPNPVPEPTLDPDAFIDTGVTSGISAVTGRLWGLTSALTADQRTGLTGTQYTAPLREDMLRALSQSIAANTRNQAARQRLSTVSRTVADLFAAVTVVNPGDSYTLATERSPLPLALRNDLPVPIRVRLQITAPPGVAVTDPGEIELPPGFLPLRVPIEVHFTQRFAIDVNLSTAEGLPLGDPVRLSVHSNAYGKVLFFITLTGGVILALLVGRRLWHRFRGQPDRADLIPPTPRRPDPLDTALAHGNDRPPRTDEPR